MFKMLKSFSSNLYKFRNVTKFNIQNNIDIQKFTLNHLGSKYMKLLGYTIGDDNNDGGRSYRNQKYTFIYFLCCIVAAVATFSLLKLTKVEPVTFG